MMNEQSDTYITIMIDSLEKKEKLLKDLEKLTKEQETILDREVFSIDDFEQCVEKKADLIEYLEELDKGFELFYQRVERVLKKEKETFRNEIQTAQKLIGHIMELSVDLQALENRNKEKLTIKLSEKRKEIKNFKVNNKMAEKYYHNMANQHQTGKSYFLDKKK